MPDVFISYSILDRKTAMSIKDNCSRFNIDAFLAEVSLMPGQIWKGAILSNLISAKYFFFLATPNSIKSDACKHEIGAALAYNRKIIPILLGIDYRHLPLWISDYHGIKIGNDGNVQFSRLLASIKKEKEGQNFAMFAGIVALGALIFTNNEKPSPRKRR